MKLTHRVNGMKNIPQFHLELVRDRSIPITSVSNTGEYVQVFHSLLDSSPVEKLVVLYVNMTSEVIGAEVIATGALGNVSATAREIFRGAICACVDRIVIGHNHPHGKCLPSYQDIIMTSTLINVGAILGIQLIDSVIVNPIGDHYSIFERQNECISMVHQEEAVDKLEQIMSELARVRKVPIANLTINAKNQNHAKT